jgi:mannose-6-phosphate isomerase-like protein (cupin superfamily)
MAKRSKARATKKRATKPKSAARKPAVKTSAAKKSPVKTSPAKTSPAKTSAVKKAAKTAVKPAKSSARRKPGTRKVRAAVPAAAGLPKAARPPQKVAVSHYCNNDFETGLRSYAQYRDLGIVEATNGMVRAHVLRFTEPCDPKVVSKLHYHDTEFQMVYVLKGWVKTKLGHHQEITMREGSAWTQPPKIKHVVTDYSDDCELLEIIMPADFETVEV